MYVYTHTRAQVAGLWVFLGAAIGSGALINMSAFLYKKWSKRNEDFEEGAGNSMRGAGSIGNRVGSKSEFQKQV